MSDKPHEHHHGHSHSHSTEFSRRKLVQAAAAFTPLGLVGSSGADPLLAKDSSGRPLGVTGQLRSDSSIWRALREHAARMTIADTHEHLWHEDFRLQKKVDAFTLFSHYTDADLVTAGMSPQAVKELQNPDIPLEKRWRDLAPYWAFTRTTGYGRCMLIAARDLFGIEDINAQTYRLLSERMAAANKPGWFGTVLKDKARIEFSVEDDLTTQRGEPLRPEPGFFKMVTRFDYMIAPRQRKDLDYVAKVSGEDIGKLTDLENALAKVFKRKIQEGMVGVKSGLAYQRSLHYEKVSRAEAERAFDKVFGSPSAEAPDPAAQKSLEDYMMHKTVQQAAEHHVVFQIHTGLEAGNRNHIARTNPSHLSDMLNEYQQVRFDLFHGGYPYGGEFASLGKNLPNVYPDLCWLHIISPGVAKRTLHELIETVPANKILGFGGDFFHVEGAYGHAQMARAVTAEVLAEKVEQGYLREEEAAPLMDRILHLNGKELFAGKPDGAS